ncbi:MAG TPA: tRNA (adenosine(37)-N6)-threonylcarbamoyltransferase complex dimerization subunit type 1 TsaB [Gemmatimonadaceae bacterium]
MSHGLTLALDGSTYAVSVALIRDRDVIAERQLPLVQTPGRGGREENFMPMVAECLRDGQVRPSDLARVVCGEGPGSFTSLRVAASIAKGIAVGANIPLFAVSSLLLLVARDDRDDGTWLSTLPAMRGEVYAALYAVESATIRQSGDPRIIRESELDDEAARAGAKIIGTAAHADETPHARGVARVIDQIVEGAACSIDSWEPVYGRLAEAQVKWEAAHGRPLSAAG